jgi:hypothetical protein
VVGNASEFGKQLDALGPVNSVDITIPSPESKSDATPPAGSNAEGKAAAEKLLDAIGGAAKVNAVKTLHQSFTMEQQGAEMAIEQSVVYPDKQAQKIKMPQGEILQVVTPASAYMLMGGQVRDLPPAMHTSELLGLKRDFLNVLQHAGDAKFTFHATGKEKVGDVEATVVDVNADGATTRWWLAPDGLLLQEQFGEVGRSGPETMMMKYSEWKSYDGLKYPTKYEMFSGDEAGGSMTLNAMEVNAAVEPQLFEKPQP